MKKLLYIDSCVNPGTSRTKTIANALVESLKNTGDYEVQELNLEKLAPAPLTTATLDKRNKLIAEGAFDDAMFDLSHQFAEADRIIIAAPFWDCGFPALLKCYIENITVTGIVSHYTDHGPEGQCKAEQLIYVTTRGGFANDEQDLGYQTIAGLSHMYGIKNVACVSANALDIPTTNVDDAVKTATENGLTLLL